jgi:sporulation protein YlmC with PRC-barrel domain
MTRITATITALSFVALLPSAGLAQTSTGTDRGTGSGSATERRAPATTDRSAPERSRPERATWSNTQGLHETGDIIGAKVEGPDGKDMGTVDALLIDPKDGKIANAVVGVGGMLGVGKEKVVVPYSALKMSGHENGRRARITIDQSALDQAPKYVKATDRSPSASPATSPRSGTTSGSGGFSGDPRSDKTRDAGSQPVDRTPPDAKSDTNKK